MKQTLAIILSAMLALNLQAQTTDSLDTSHSTLLTPHSTLLTPHSTEKDSLPSPLTPKTIGLVLSGGGAKGVAHIGALKVMERAGLPIHVIAGTSMGSIIGGAYACGHSAATLDSVVRSQDWLFVLTDRRDRSHLSLLDREKQNTYVYSNDFSFRKGDKDDGGGILTGRNISTLFTMLTAPYNDSLDFSRLPIPFSCVATNIVDNTEHVFHRGVLPRAMRASMAIPGVFAPVRMDSMVLIDGGMRNNFPVDIAREMGADFIIGVDVQETPRGADKLNSTSQILGQIMDWICRNKYEENLKRTNIHIKVNTDGYSAASFTKAAVDTLIRRGEEAAMEHWDELVALSKRLGTWDGRPTRSEKPEQLHVKAEHQQRDFLINLGVRFDNEEMVALQANAEVPIRTKVPMDLEMTLRLGKRIMARVDWAFRPISFLKPTLSYTFRHNDIDFYEYGDLIYNATYNQHTAKLSLFNFNIRNFNVTIGAQWDYYDYHSLLVNSTSDHDFDEDDTRDKGYLSYEAQVTYNSENQWFFPTSGVRFNARFAYITDNLIRLDGAVGVRDYSAMLRASFPLSSRFTLQPMFYGRMLVGNVPFIMGNMMGGEWFNHYMDRQMPFAGVAHMEMAWEKMLAAQLQLQYKPTANNNILLRVAVGQDSPDFKNLLRHKSMIGAALSYYYSSLFGPLGGSVGYSNITKKFYYYVNLGFVF